MPAACQVQNTRGGREAAVLSRLYEGDQVLHVRHRIILDFGLKSVALRMSGHGTELHAHSQCARGVHCGQRS